MRTLNKAEIMWASGGEIDTEGYNTSFLVSNTVIGGVIGTVVAIGYAICSSPPFAVSWKPTLFTAAAFGSYALAMMTAKITDAYLFSPVTTTPIISPPLG